MISFPGFYDNNGSMVNYYNWFDNINLKFATLLDYIWLSLNFLSLVITIFAVYKILKITSTLGLTNSNVKVNKKTFIAHVFVLCLQFIAAIGYAF